MIRRPPRSTQSRDRRQRQMCIRDSDYDKLMKYRLDLLKVHKLGLPDIQKVIAEMGPMAVSYTHLRAHETVLDLVCRLLLEKKKTHYTLPRHMRDHTTHFIPSIPLNPIITTHLITLPVHQT